MTTKIKIFNAGDRVIVKHSPHYGEATVDTGAICPITQQVTVSFADDWGFHYFYPENLECVQDFQELDNA